MFSPHAATRSQLSHRCPEADDHHQFDDRSNQRVDRRDLWPGVGEGRVPHCPQEGVRHVGELLAAMADGKVQLAGMTTQSVLALLSFVHRCDDAPVHPSSTPASTPSPPRWRTPTARPSKPRKSSRALPENLEIGTPTTAEDKDVVFCAKTFTDTNSIVTLTDLGTKSSTATLAAPDGFDAASPLGAAGLKSLYNIEFKAVVPTDAAKTIEAVTVVLPIVVSAARPIRLWRRPPSPCSKTTRCSCPTM